ncbi:MAG: murein biosynthesis integral membrane protein MurJ [Planctomycetes bacterium]|nr:murein biosynthesis integral membrane protein MurJ [Planctomycetota bacterium]
MASTNTLPTKKNIAGATVLVATTSLLGIVLGYVKLSVVTASFGATRMYDAYVIAFTFPDMLSNMLVGAMGVTFIPLYTEYLLKDGEGKAWEFFSNFVNLTFTFTIALCLLTIPLSPLVVRLIAPGLEDEYSELAARLMMVMLPIIAVMALSRLVTSCLNSHHHFAAPALGSVLNLLVAILCVVLLAPRYGIYSLAFGVLVGSLGRLFIQVPAVIGMVKNYRMTFDIHHRQTRRIVSLILPLIAGSCVVQIGVVVERILASGLSEGCISYLGYSRSIMVMSTQVFIGSIAVVLFPVLSRCVSSGDTVQVRETLSAGIRMGNFLLIPVCAAFYFFGDVIIQVLFERGAFVESMTEGTANALALYSISMLAFASYYMVTYVFYALKEFYLLIKTATVVTVIGIILRVVLVKSHGYAGLALASSLTMIIHTSILMILLRYQLKSVDGSRMCISFLKVCFASTGAVTCCALLNGILMDAHPQPMQFVCLGLIGVASFLIIALLLKLEELFTVVEMFKKSLLGT